MRPAFGPGLASATAAANWWEAGGATGCVAAYQPKGAASLAASYVNLANPGTHDAAPGIAPTWDTTNGWIFATTQYLNVALTTTNETWTLIYQFTGASVSNVFAYAVGASSGAAFSFCFGPNFLNGARYISGAQTITVAPNLTSGVAAVAGKSAYLNGTSQGTIPAGTSTANLGWSIGRVKNGSSGAAHNCQAMAIYNNTLTGPQVAAISTAMAAL